MGRKKIEIDWKRVDKLLKCQCNGTGIASLLGISADTLYRACESTYKIGFAAYSAQKKSEGKELLREKQMDTALEGDKTLLVWLGKQYLEQSDKTQNTNRQVDEFKGKTDQEIEEELKALNERGKNISD